MNTLYCGSIGDYYLENSSRKKTTQLFSQILHNNTRMIMKIFEMKYINMYCFSQGDIYNHGQITMVIICIWI